MPEDIYGITRSKCLRSILWLVFHTSTPPSSLTATGNLPEPNLLLDLNLLHQNQHHPLRAPNNWSRNHAAIENRGRSPSVLVPRLLSHSNCSHIHPMLSAPASTVRCRRKKEIWVFIACGESEEPLLWDCERTQCPRCGYSHPTVLCAWPRPDRSKRETDSIFLIRIGDYVSFRCPSHLVVIDGGGCSACLCAILRLYYFPKTWDSTWVMWKAYTFGTLETNLAIICVCVPQLKKLVSHVGVKFAGKCSRSTKRECGNNSEGTDGSYERRRKSEKSSLADDELAFIRGGYPVARGSATCAV